MKNNFENNLVRDLILWIFGMLQICRRFSDLDGKYVGARVKVANGEVTFARMAIN